MGKIYDMPDGNTEIWKAGFSLSWNPISILAKKHLKIEFRLLVNIVAKSVMSKVRSYDKINQEKFNYMAFIASKIDVNLFDIHFGTLYEMIREKDQLEGFNTDLLFSMSFKCDLWNL